jgi:hypothetical protein
LATLSDLLVPPQEEKQQGQRVEEEQEHELRNRAKTSSGSQAQSYIIVHQQPRSRVPTW